VVSIGVVASAITTLPLVHGAGSLGRAAVISLGVSVLGLAVVSLRFPYSETRPKRVDLSHVETDGRSAVLVSGRDAFAMGEIWRGLPEAERPEAGRWPGFRMNPQRSAVIPAPPPAMPAPHVEILEEKTDASPGGRRVTLRIHPTSPVLRLSVPQHSLAAWSFGPLAATPPMDGRYRALFYNLGPGGHDVTLELHGQEAVEIELRGTDGAPAAGPAVRAVLQALPTWTTATAVSHRVIRRRI